MLSDGYELREGYADLDGVRLHYASLGSTGSSACPTPRTGSITTSMNGSASCLLISSLPPWPAALAEGP
jgi:hypothetical protein